MTYEEIIQAHKDGKVFAGRMIEDAADFDFLVFPTEASARGYCLSCADGETDITVIDVGETHIEVPDPQGYYSGSHGRYSLVPMLYPISNVVNDD